MFSQKESSGEQCDSESERDQTAHRRANHVIDACVTRGACDRDRATRANTCRRRRLVQCFSFSQRSHSRAITSNFALLSLAVSLPLLCPPRLLSRCPSFSPHPQHWHLSGQTRSPPASARPIDECLRVSRAFLCRHLATSHAPPLQVPSKEPALLVAGNIHRDGRTHGIRHFG